MTNAHAQNYDQKREVEEVLALLHDVEQEAAVIIRQAYEFGDEEIFKAGKAQKKALSKMREIVETKWRLFDGCECFSNQLDPRGQRSD